MIVSKCSGELKEGTCPLRDTCMRYRLPIPTDPAQRRWVYPDFIDGDCENYWYFDGFVA